MNQHSREPTAALPVPSEVEGTVLTDANLEILIDALRTDPEALALVVSRVGPDDGRRDGWTPFARRFFLQTLAETGRVSEACRWAQLSKQSAYALRARDPVFAAGWDAACEIARTQLADALFEKAIDGVTETIIKDGEVVAERHRFDSRLSIAVLNRLDKRCDRSAELGSPHLAVVRNWEDFLSHIGRAEDESAEALLQAQVLTPAECASHGQFGQLPLGESPTDKPEEPKQIDLSDRYWQDEDRWLTDFPPPANSTGWQKGKWSDYGYERDCTPEEAAIIEADVAADEAAELEHEEQLRDAWFRMIAASLEPHEEDEESGANEEPEDCSEPAEHAGGDTAV